MTMDKTPRFIDRHVPFQPAATTGIPHQYHDVPYAPGARHTLDIYLPNDGVAPFPVVIDVYGGGLYFGQKSSHKLNPALQLRSAGYAIVSPDYSLSYQQPFPTQISELKAAIRFVRAKASLYGLDPNRIALMGESSGAHLAVLTAASETVGRLDRGLGNHLGVSAAVSAVIASYGPYQFDQFSAQFDLLKITPKFRETGQADSFEGVMFGGHAPAQITDQVTAADPAHYLTAKMPPLLLTAGTADQVVPYVQSFNLAASAMTVMGTDQVQLHLVDGAHHGPADFMTADIVAERVAFLNRWLD